MGITLYKPSFLYGNLKSFAKIPINIIRIDSKFCFFIKGNNRSPKFYVWADTLFLLVTVGSFPVTTTVYYIKEPVDMVVGTTNSDLNTLLHPVIVKMAATRLLASWHRPKVNAVRCDEWSGGRALG